MPDTKKLNMQELADIIKFPTTIGKDNVVVIAGGEGDGKSLFQHYGLGPALDPEYDLWRSVVYTDSMDEFNEKYEYLKINWAIDEAIRVLYKLDFMLGIAKDLVKKFAADVRKEKGAVHSFLIPDISELNKYFREQRVTTWIEFIQREHLVEGESAAVVFQKPRIHFRPTNVDVWLLKDYYEKYMKAFKKSGYGDATIDIMRNHPFYIGEIYFKKPSETKIARYLEYRQMAINRYSQSKEHVSAKEQKWRLFALRMVKHGLLNKWGTLTDMAKIGNHIIHEDTLSYGLKRIKDEKL